MKRTDEKIESLHKISKLYLKPINNLNNMHVLKFRRDSLRPMSNVTLCEFVIK